MCMHGLFAYHLLQKIMSVPVSFFSHQTGLALASFWNEYCSSLSALSVMLVLLLFHVFLMSSWCLNFFCVLSLVYSIFTSFFHLAVSLVPHDCCCVVVPVVAAGEEVEPVAGGGAGGGILAVAVGTGQATQMMTQTRCVVGNDVVCVVWTPGRCRCGHWSLWWCYH